MSAAAPSGPGATDARPWYRHSWPWLLMLGPALVVVAGGVTTWLAVRSDDGLVADDYYKRGLAINRQIERGERAAALGLTATVDLGTDGRARVRLASAAADGAARPPAVRVVIAHPTRSGEDSRATLVRTPDGSYAGKVPPPAPGRWRIHVETDEWRLPAVEIDGPRDGVALAAQR
jgi:hypothetical protein